VTPLRSLSRIVLICRDAERLSEFYARAFGFAPVADAPEADADFARLIGLARGTVRTRTLHLGAQHVALAQPEPSGRLYPADVPGWSSQFQHFAIVVSDMAAAFAALRATPGWIAISTGGPQTLPESSGGVTAFKFRDPDGHPLELLAFPGDATPAGWMGRAEKKPFLGVDHSAISVAETARSVAFYEGIGLTRVGGSLNAGPEQERLDGLADALVEVTALAPPLHRVPHVELLCYGGDFMRPEAVTGATDIAATQLVFAVTAEAFTATIRRNHAAVVGGPIVSQRGCSLVLLRDPDGHLLCLEAQPPGEGQ
jgi:catechol 2,3-dioxygenase-like lactoylglutathione lyase family enzyme